MGVLNFKNWGRFSVDFNDVNENADALLSLMGTVIIVRADANLQTDALDYLAISPEFDEVEEGQEVPHYSVELGEDGSVAWTKVEE